jgi:hypothetical protein
MVVHFFLALEKKLQLLRCKIKLHITNNFSALKSKIQFCNVNIAILWYFCNV